MSNSLLKALYLLSGSSILIPITVGLMNYRLLDRNLKWAFYFLLVTAANDIVSISLALSAIRNQFVNNLYPIEVIIFLPYIYYRLTPFKKFILVSGIALLVFSIVNYIFIQGPHILNSYTRVLLGLSLIIYALLYFYHTFKEAKILNLEKHPMFWINSAVLIYFSWNFFLFLLYNNNIVGDTIKYHNDYWLIHSFFYVVSNILFAIGLWNGRRNLMYPL